MWAPYFAGVISALIAAVTFRLRHREPIYRRSYIWIGLTCLGEGVVAAALRGTTGAITGVASPVGLSALTVLYGVALPLAASTGVTKVKGKWRFQLQNGFTRRIDRLIADQSAAGTALGQQRDVELIMGRQNEASRLDHRYFDDYGLHLQQRRATQPKQQKVRTIATDSSPLDERVAAILGMVVEEGHWEFYRSERKAAKHAARVQRKAAKKAARVQQEAVRTPPDSGGPR